MDTIAVVGLLLLLKGIANGLSELFSGQRVNFSCKCFLCGAVPVSVGGKHRGGLLFVLLLNSKEQEDKQTRFLDDWAEGGLDRGVKRVCFQVSVININHCDWTGL